ncbi:Hypothetical_protein [Hexamita inflata]|uniref:Hypothetical_protein n=1 Tax=Hexamita inflata TaxID=28002 RepID=A0AA86NDP0_9EUKA|nr:Hypothetical protein HINF_LOCUS4804 [Hexamita inflata]
MPLQTLRNWLRTNLARQPGILAPVGALAILLNTNFESRLLFQIVNAISGQSLDIYVRVQLMIIFRAMPATSLKISPAVAPCRRRQIRGIILTSGSQFMDKSFQGLFSPSEQAKTYSHQTNGRKLPRQCDGRHTVINRLSPELRLDVIIPRKGTYQPVQQIHPIANTLQIISKTEQRSERTTIQVCSAIGSKDILNSEYSQNCCQIQKNTNGLLFRSFKKINITNPALYQQLFLMLSSIILICKSVNFQSKSLYANNLIHRAPGVRGPSRFSQ